MLCKKCGAEIADTSKFCGYCGEVVETNEIMQPSNIENNEVVENTITEADLGETIKIDLVQPENQISDVTVPPIGPGLPGYVEPVVEPVASTQPEVQNQVPVNGPVMPNTEGNKKNNKLVFIIGGVVLALIAIVLVIFAMNNSSNSISVLKKTMANLSEAGKDSATATAKLNIEAGGQNLSLSATAKVEKKSEEEFDMQLMVDKSLFTEEMSVYAKVGKDKVNVYMESTTIDLLGMTSSLTPSWVYYTLKLDEIMSEMNAEENTNSELKLEDVIDAKHFVFVDSVDKINHYQLIIDQELINNIKAKADELANEDLKDSFDDMEELEQAIKVDFYITDSNELAKIKLDMSEYLTEEDDISGLSISIELKDLNNTKVEIPSEALKSTTDIDTYMAENSIDYSLDYDSSYDYDMDSDMNLDLNGDMTLDTNFGF